MYRRVPVAGGLTPCRIDLNRRRDQDHSMDVKRSPDKLNDLMPVLADIVHAIGAMPFDLVLTRPAAAFRENAARIAESQFRASLSDAARVRRLAKLGHIERQSGAVRLVFSEEALGRLRSGDWTIPVDKATGLRRAEVRDAAGRIREGARYDSVSGTQRLLRSVVAAANVISALDLQAQLERLDAKLDRVISFQQADRLGELRGAYLSLQKALVDPDSRARRSQLLQVSLHLDELQGRFLQTARAELEATPNPEDISWFRAIFSFQSTAERELRTAVARAHEDLRLHQLCARLGAVVHAELDQPEALATQTAAVAAGVASLVPLLAEKVGYFDDAAAEAVRALARPIGAISGSLAASFNTSNGELTLAVGERHDDAA
jgi:hypothetical protein